MHTTKKLIILSLFIINSANCFGENPPDYNTGQSLLYDFFTSSDNGNWTFYNRFGRIAEGRLWIDGSYVPNSIGRDGWALTHIGDRSWRNYTYSVFYDNENISGYPDHHESTFYFRVAAEADNIRQIMYRLDIWSPGDVKEGGSCPNWNNGAIGLTKYVDGVGQDLAEVCRSNTNIGTNAVKIDVRGGNINVEVNGKVLLKYHDTNPIPYGGVGVGQIWETNGWYDNVLVTRQATSFHTASHGGNAGPAFPLGWPTAPTRRGGRGVIR